MRRYWSLLLMLAVVGITGGALVTTVQAPVYTATAKAFVGTRSTGSVTDLTQGSIYTQQIVSSYTDAATTPYVLDAVIKELSLDTTAQQLAEAVSASAPPDTAIVNITVTDESAKAAADIANAVDRQLANAVDTLSTAGGTVAPVQLTTLQVATPARTPSSPRPALNLGLGLIAGLALAAVVMFLRETLRTRLRGQDDMERIIDGPVLGAVPVDASARTRAPMVAQATRRRTTVEAFRRLRTNLERVQRDVEGNTWIVTAPVPGAGASTVALNLALAMARGGARVVVVDADLARAGLSAACGLADARGLAEASAGRAPIGDALHLLDSGLFVMPTGSADESAELTASSGARAVLRDLGRRFDAVVVDAPPLLASSDAAVLTRDAAGALVVASSGRVRRAELQSALAVLHQAGGRLAGVVANRLPTRGPDALQHVAARSARTATKKAPTRSAAREPIPASA